MRSEKIADWGIMNYFYIITNKDSVLQNQDLVARWLVLWQK